MGKQTDLNKFFKNDDSTVEAIWCVDSETGEEVLVDVWTRKVLAHRKNGRIIRPKGE